MAVRRRVVAAAALGMLLLAVAAIPGEARSAGLRRGARVARKAEEASVAHSARHKQRKHHKKQRVHSRSTGRESNLNTEEAHPATSQAVSAPTKSDTRRLSRRTQAANNASFLSSGALNSWQLEFGTVLCGVELAGVLQTTVTSAYPGTLQSVQFTGLTLNVSNAAAHAGDPFAILKIPGIIPATVNVTSGTTASAQLTLGMMKADVVDTVQVGYFASNVMAKATAGLTAIGTVNATVTTSEGRFIGLQQADFDIDVGGLGLQSSLSKVTSFSLQSLPNAAGLQAVVGVSISNPESSRTVTMSPFCALVTVNGAQIGDGCDPAGKAITLAPGSTVNTQLLVPQYAPVTAADPIAGAVAAVFSGTPPAVAFAAQTDLHKYRCINMALGALPAQPTSSFWGEHMLVPDVVVHTAPLFSRSSSLNMSLGLRNPVNMTATVSISSITVLDNSSTPLSMLHAAVAGLPTKIDPLGFTTTPFLLAEITYVGSDSAISALTALTGGQATVLRVQVEGNVTLPGSGPLPFSYESFATLSPRFTPVSGCTTNEDCPQSFCVTMGGVSPPFQCAQDPQRSCNPRPSCGAGGQVLSNGNGTCHCACVSPCFSGSNCSTFNASCAGAPLQQYLDQVSSSTSCTTCKAGAAAAAEGFGYPINHGSNTLGVGQGFDIGDISGATKAPKGPVVECSFYPAASGVFPYTSQMVPQEVSFNLTNATVGPTVQVFRSVSDLAKAVHTIGADVTTQQVSWFSVMFPDDSYGPAAVGPELEGNDLFTNAVDAVQVATATLQPGAHLSSCVQTLLVEAEAVLKADPSSAAATQYLTQIQTQYGPAFITEATFGGVVGLAARLPYDIAGNPAPGASVLSTAQLSASAGGLLSTMTGRAGTVDPLYKPTATGQFCSPSIDNVDCFANYSSWVSALFSTTALQTAGAPITLKAQPFATLFPAAPLTSAALIKQASQSWSSLDGIVDCDSSRCGDGKCGAATDEACTCRTGDAPPATGAGSYGRNCHQCSQDLGYAWAGSICASGLQWTGHGCGACPAGNEVYDHDVDERDDWFGYCGYDLHRCNFPPQAGNFTEAQTPECQNEHVHGELWCDGSSDLDWTMTGTVKKTDAFWSDEYPFSGIRT